MKLGKFFLREKQKETFDFYFFPPPAVCVSVAVNRMCHAEVTPESTTAIIRT